MIEAEDDAKKRVSGFIHHELESFGPRALEETGVELLTLAVMEGRLSTIPN